MIIVERIKELLKEQGLTNKAFFKGLGMTVNTLTNWEKGGTPNQVSLMQIADALGVSVSYIKGETDNRHSESFTGKYMETVIGWFDEFEIELDSYDDDNGAGQEYVLSYKGKSHNYQEWEFNNLCTSLYKHSKSAYDLVMKDFIATTFPNESLDKDEQDLLNAFRSLKGMQKLKIVHYCLSAMEENARQEGQI